jgi:hypothetical protein
VDDAAAAGRGQASSDAAAASPSEMASTRTRSLIGRVASPSVLARVADAVGEQHDRADTGASGELGARQRAVVERGATTATSARIWSAGAADSSSGG